jgi:hypothetical protein
MTPSPAAVDVQVATDEDLREAIDDVPQAAGVSLEELREQAEASRHIGGRRITWFMSPSSLTGSPL